MSFFKKIKEVFTGRSNQEVYSEGLNRKKNPFVNQLLLLFEEENEIDAAWIEKMMIVLIQADVSVDTARKLIRSFEKLLTENGISEKKYAKDLFLQTLNDFYGNDSAQLEIIPNQVNVILLVGVNGSGKTTSAAKLANYYLHQNLKVGLVAGDTFRAAATDQLKLWSEKLNVSFFSGPLNADPSSVLADAAKAAVEQGIDVLICDTAGRLQNKTNLMNELAKMKRVLGKFITDAPHATYLVLDANLGQNSLTQAKEFEKATALDGIILTKMDGTAKGGIIFTIIDEMNLKVNFIGLGEKMDDLRPFIRDTYFEALLKQDE